MENLLRSVKLLLGMERGAVADFLSEIASLRFPPIRRLNAPGCAERLGWPKWTRPQAKNASVARERGRAGLSRTNSQSNLMCSFRFGTLKNEGYNNAKERADSPATEAGRRRGGAQ